jgi:hypothetical protein
MSPIHIRAAALAMAAGLLAAFALANGTTQPIPSGTLAVQWVFGHWTQQPPVLWHLDMDPL